MGRRGKEERAAGIQRSSLQDAEDVVTEAAGGGEGGVHRGQGQSAVCGYLAFSKTVPGREVVPEDVLRTGRDGESDQGTAAVVVCRSDLRDGDASQSASGVVFLGGLLDDVSTTTCGLERH